MKLPVVRRLVQRRYCYSSLPACVNEPAIRQGNPYVGDLAVFRVFIPRKEYEIARAQCLSTYFHEPIPSCLLISISRDRHSAKPVNPLGKSGAVDTKRSAAAPKVWHTDHSARNKRQVRPQMLRRWIVRYNDGAALDKRYTRVG